MLKKLLFIFIGLSQTLLPMESQERTIGRDFFGRDRLQFVPSPEALVLYNAARRADQANSNQNGLSQLGQELNSNASDAHAQSERINLFVRFWQNFKRRGFNAQFGTVPRDVIFDLSAIQALLLLNNEYSFDERLCERLVWYACSLDSEKVLRFFIDSGFDINKRLGSVFEPEGTALLAAVSANNVDIVRLLLRHGALSNVASFDGRTPLDIAENKGCEEIKHILIERGAQRGRQNLPRQQTNTTREVTEHEDLTGLLIDDRPIPLLISHIHDSGTESRSQSNIDYSDVLEFSFDPRPSLPIISIPTLLANAPEPSQFNVVVPSYNNAAWAQYNGIRTDTEAAIPPVQPIITAHEVVTLPTLLANAPSETLLNNLQSAPSLSDAIAKILYSPDELSGIQSDVRLTEVKNKSNVKKVVPSLQSLLLKWFVNRALNLSKWNHTLRDKILKLILRNVTKNAIDIVHDPAVLEVALILSKIDKALIKEFLKIIIERQNVAALEVILKYGALPNELYEKGDRPLHLAALTGNGDIVAMLLKAGASINALNDHNQTPLDLALPYGDDSSIVTLLLSRKALIGKEVFAEREQEKLERFRKEEQLRQYAAVGNTAAVIRLLDDGVGIDAQDEKGFTALMFACQNGHYQTVELLVLRKATLDITNKVGQTAYALAYKKIAYNLEQNKDLAHSDYLDIMALVDPQNQAMYPLRGHATSVFPQ